MKYQHKSAIKRVHIFFPVSKYINRQLSFLSILGFKTKLGVESLLSLNSERLSINERLSTVKEAIAADECSLGITASPWDGREITICIKHWRGTGAVLIKTEVA